MKTKLVPAILIFCFGFIAEAQDLERLRKYTYKQFDVSSLFSMSYTVNSFALNSDNELQSEDMLMLKIDELKDSYRRTADINHLKLIKDIYGRLNQIDSVRQYRNALESKCFELLELDLNNAEVYNNLCELYIEMADFYAAMEIANQLLDLNPNDSVAILTNLIANYFCGDFGNANSYAERAIRNFPETPGVYFLKTMLVVWGEGARAAESHSFNGLTADLSYLSEISEENRQDEHIQFVVSVCDLLLWYFEKVLTATFNQSSVSEKYKIKLDASDSLRLSLIENKCRKLIKKNSFKNHYISYHTLGNLNFIEEDYNTAISYFQKSITLAGCSREEKENVIANYDNIMFSYLLLHDTISAEKWMNIKMKDERCNASGAQDLVALACYELIKGDLSKGEEVLLEAVLQDSTNYQAYVELANIEMIRTNYDLAEEYLDKCFKLKKDYPKMTQSFILLSLFQGEIGTASYFVNKLLLNEPDNSFALELKNAFF